MTATGITLVGMPRKFANKVCVCCPLPSTRKGDHVLPEWLLGDGQSSGPFTATINDVPVLGRDGTPRTWPDMARVTVPMCNPDGRGCNAKLNRRFEVPAKELIRALVRLDGRITLSPIDARAVGLWFLKTILLWAHPEAHHSVFEYAPRRWAAPPASLYAWMIDGQDPPADLSLWVTRPRSPRPDDPAPRYIDLPTVECDGTDTVCEVQVIGFHGLELTLVYHPGWQVNHPQVPEGTAIQMWPPSSHRVDLVALVPANPRDTLFVDGPLFHLAPGGFEGTTLPPLSPETDMFELMRNSRVLGGAAPRLAS